MPWAIRSPSISNFLDSSAEQSDFDRPDEPADTVTYPLEWTALKKSYASQPEFNYLGLSRRLDARTGVRGEKGQMNLLDAVGS